MKSPLLFAVVFIAAAPLCARISKALPRTADGHPDLQGIWTNVTLTTLERPDELKDKATLSDAEAKAWAQKDIQTGVTRAQPAPVLITTFL
jgi:hypothetical protein